MTNKKEAAISGGGKISEKMGSLLKSSDVLSKGDKPRYKDIAKKSESGKAVNNSTASDELDYLPLGLMKPDGSFEEIIKVPHCEEPRLNEQLRHEIFEALLPICRDSWDDMKNPYHRVLKDREG